MNGSHRKFVVAWLAFVIALGVYYRTLAPTVTLVDSGELAMACRLLDIAHPPGVPLYMLIGWAFSHLPWRTVVWRLNLMSAFFAALTVALAFLGALKTLRRAEPSPDNKQRKNKRDVQKRRPGAERQPKSWMTELAALLAALTFAFSNTLWSFATLTEVYTGNLALLGLILILIIANDEVVSGTQDRRPFYWRFFILSLTFGLALCVHHLSILFTAPAILYFLLIRHRTVFLKPRTLLMGALFILLGLSVYAYLPLRAMRKPLLNWGDPSNAQNFYWHISGRQYYTHLFSGNTWNQFEFFLTLWLDEFAYVGIAVILVGAFILWRRNRPLFWFTAIIALSDVLYSINYDIGEDKEAYYLPFFLICTLWLASGIHWMLMAAMSRSKQLIRYGAIGGLCLLPFLNLYTHYHRNDRSRYYIAYDYAMNVLSGVRENGIVLTPDWQLYSPILYLQHIEHVRPDVVFIDVNLLRRVWYMDHLRRQFPWLVASSQPQITAYMSELYRFEHKLPPYDSADYDPSKIQHLYVNMINAFIEKNIDSREIHLTLQMLSAEFEGVGKKYERVPYGLTFRLQNDKSFVAQPEPTLTVRGLLDGTAYLDHVALRIRDDYGHMLYNRGAYFSLHNRHEEALEAYKKALAFNPRNSQTYRMMGKSYALLGKLPEALEAYRKALALEPDNRAIRLEWERVKKLAGAPN